MTTFWLRAETKNNERRSPLTPENAKKLIAAGAKVFVEKSEDRIFSDQAYLDAGCELAEAHSWQTANPETYILGLKELPDETFPLNHKHIYFAHAYKGQDGAINTLKRFTSGKGKLLDLEYLVDDNKRRIAAFGKWAGFVGAAVAVDAYYHAHVLNSKFPKLISYDDQENLINRLKKNIAQGNTEKPEIIIIGAKGRCGQGAVELLNHLGLKATEWDYQETKKGGPFKEISNHHIFINTALILDKIPPFVDESILNDETRLKIISDVSCDPTGDLNPIPIYCQSTSWENPLLEYKNGDVELDIISVDNLPSVLPKESSIDFSNQLTPYLIDLIKNGEDSMVWKNALKSFNDTCSEFNL